MLVEELRQSLEQQPLTLPRKNIAKEMQEIAAKYRALDRREWQAIEIVIRELHSM